MIDTKSCKSLASTDLIKTLFIDLDLINGQKEKEDE